MIKTTVTCWWGFVDIDGFACAIAYAELLRLEWRDAIAVLPDPLNSSVTAEIRELHPSYESVPKTADAYVIVDMSDPEIIQKFAPLHKVTEIYDHHFGFEEYWKVRLHERSKIEPIGAAATLIWEEFKARSHAWSISHESATVLAHAIISNTVNFLMGLTCERDRNAVTELAKIARLENDWISKYFQSQQRYIELNPTEAILNDTKFVTFAPFWRIAFGQSEIWDSEEFFRSAPFERALDRKDVDAWLFNCVDIQKGQTRICSNSQGILEKISKTFWLRIDWSRLFADKIILRKEILKILS